MAIGDNTCEGSHYDCGDTTPILIGVTASGEISHIRNELVSFMLGATEIIVNKKTRNFALHYSHGWSSNPSFAMPQIDIAGVSIYFTCGGDTNLNSNQSVSESYESVTTALYLLDTRYNNAVGRETTERITFSKSSNTLAGFKEPWGIGYYPKYTITNHVLDKTIVYFIVLNGVKTILKTEITNEVINGPSNPLILVYPQPPSLAIPWINCDDIKLFGFYDYHAVGAEEGQVKIQHDGGDDFYFTDWMRNIGALSNEQDQQDADDRYFEFYLGGTYNPSQSYSNPGIYIDSTPCCSVAVDPNGNVMYSVELGGEVFNFLTGGDLTTFDPEHIPAGSRLFPVGII
jgi:hypothetical protein